MFKVKRGNLPPKPQVSLKNVDMNILASLNLKQYLWKLLF